MAQFVGRFKSRAVPGGMVSALRAANNVIDIAVSGTRSVKSSNEAAYGQNNGVFLGGLATQLFVNTAFSGAVSGSPGTGPTGWSVVVSTGSLSAVDAIDLGNALTIACTAQRLTYGQTVSVSANTKYTNSAELLEVSGTVSYQNVVSCTTPPSGATVSYRHNGVSVSATDTVSGTGKIEAILSVAGTAGTCSFRVGLGCVSNQTATVKLRSPQLQSGAIRDRYIHNTSTSATAGRDIRDFSGSLSDLGIRSQKIGYTIAAAMHFGYPSGQIDSAFPRLLGIGSLTAQDRCEITFNPNTGRFYTGVIQSGVSVAETSTTAGEVSWSQDQVCFCAASWGVSDGLLLMTQRPDGTRYIDANTTSAAKAESATDMAGYALGGYFGNGVAVNTGIIAECPGLIIADYAMTEDELNALALSMFDAVPGRRMLPMGVGIGVGF